MTDRGKAGYLVYRRGAIYVYQEYMGRNSILFQAKITSNFKFVVNQSKWEFDLIKVQIH